MEKPAYPTLDDKSEEICLWYNKEIESLRNQTLSEGKLRNRKGKTFETGADKLWEAAWVLSGGSPKLLNINAIKIPYDYASEDPEKGISLGEVKQQMYENNPEGKKRKKLKPGIGTDRNVYVNEELVASNEIKTYCDLSMFKRAYTEFESFGAISQVRPSFVIIQCENALGGDIHESAVCSDTFLMGNNLKAYLSNRRRLLGESSPQVHILTTCNAKRCSKKEMSNKETPFVKERMREILFFMTNLFRGICTK